jgi:hypothetical protein
LPSDGKYTWRRWIDTALEPPQEIVEWREAPPVPGATYHSLARSVVVLVAGSGLEGDDHPKAAKVILKRRRNRNGKHHGEIAHG